MQDGKRNGGLPPTTSTIKPSLFKKQTFSQRFKLDDHHTISKSRDRLSGSLDNSQKLQSKIKQTEQQLLRLMDSDSSEIYRS